VVPQAAEEGSSPPGAAESAAPPEDARPAIAFVGTSLTAGYGLAAPEDDRYTAVLQRRVDSLGLGFRVVNAGVSGDTSRGGLERMDWVLRTDPRVLVIELGGNDGLRGIDPAAMEDNLQAIIDRAREQRPDIRIVVTGMQAPPNLGPRYGQEFAAVFARIAERNDTEFVPFILEDVGGIPELNQADGIHPTPEGHRIMADNVWRVLEPMLREVRAP